MENFPLSPHRKSFRGTPCIDLIGPYNFGPKMIGKKPNPNHIQLHCLTMIDPATGFFEVCEIGRKQADYVANHLEMHWLTRYPWPTEITMDKGTEFAAEVSETLKGEYGITRKIIASRNP